ncbi:DUF3110 domain-containing protein [Synechococcus sp. PCC 7336]|uniref:DUF3110 domain-containing protein n=1 Tax=Synechococcus sp. PCC 7336 TaxID=195250 RepID=UPI00034730A8|nr:DUF3110 domain-containing protein [Synechococcus sp. PCC 7336]
MRVFVLLLNADTDSEGIHTLKQGQTDTVLMFEQEDDAARFAMMLEAQDFPTLTVEAIDDEDIKEFCQSAGFRYRLVTPKDLVVPPEANLSEDAWDLNREGETAATEVAEGDRDSDGKLSDAALERLRKQFENLL